MTTNLSDKQILFLEALVGEAKGDFKKAKEIAGYAPAVSIRQIIRPLRDQILKLTDDIIVFNTIKAAFALDDVMDNPAIVGAGNKINAAKEVLDRAGLGKKDNSSMQLPQGAVIIMPPKKEKTVDADDT